MCVISHNYIVWCFVNFEIVWLKFHFFTVIHVCDFYVRELCLTIPGPPFLWVDCTPYKGLYPLVPDALRLKLKPTGFRILLVNVSESSPQKCLSPNQKIKFSIFFFLKLKLEKKNLIDEIFRKRFFSENSITFFGNDK